MKNLLLTTTLTLLLCTTTSHALEYTLSGVIDPLQAEPNGGFGAFDGTIAGAGDGSGTISGTYDDVTNLLNYTLTWQNLSGNVTNMHFHLGAAGASGGVDLGVPGPWASPQIGTDIVVPDDKEANLLGGNWYLNIHSSNFGGGEVRGQVHVTPIPEPTTFSLISIASIALLSAVRRRS